MSKRAILKAAFFTLGVRGRWGLPLLFEGPPGTGKTSFVESSAGAFGLSCQTVLASIREPSDFVGLPVLHEGGVRYAPPAWARSTIAEGSSVVFFDEINTAPPSVQGALLRVILDGVVGELEVPPTVRFAAAQNSVEEAAGGWDLAAPLANRFGHIRWERPEASDWAGWLLGGGEDAGEQPLSAAAEEARVMDAWAGPWATARGTVAAFIQRRPELLHKQPKPGDPAASRAWPSPRTWEMAARALAGASVHGLSQTDEEILVAAFVSEGAASELAIFREALDLPDPVALLEGREVFKHDPKRLDRTFAVLSSCAAVVTPATAPDRAARAAALWNPLGPIADDAADLVVGAAKLLVQAKIHALPEARKVLARIQPFAVFA